MTKQLILSVIANDRPGLVDELSALVSEHDGNWLESRMAHLAEKFAGVVRIELPNEQQADLLKSRMATLEDSGIHVSITEARQEAARSESTFVVDLVGPDQPGIVHDITHCLSKHRVSIESMETTIEDAPMGGGKLFQAHFEVRIPTDLDEETLGGELEKLSNALLVNLDLRMADGSDSSAQA